MSTDFTRFRKTAKIVSILDMIVQAFYMIGVVGVCAITQSTAYFDDIIEHINGKFQSSDQYWVMDASSEKSKQATQRIYVILWVYAAIDCIVSMSQIGSAVALLLSSNPAKDLKGAAKLATGWFVYNIGCFVLYAAWRVYIQLWLILVIGFIVRVCLLALGYKYVHDLRATLDEEGFNEDPNRGVNGVNLSVRDPLPPLAPIPVLRKQEPVEAPSK